MAGAGGCRQLERSWSHMSRARRSGRQSSVEVREPLDLWRRGLRRLTDQGRQLWLLGEGLEALLTVALDGKTHPVDEEAAAAALLSMAQRLLEAVPGQVTGGSGKATVRAHSQLAPKASSRTGPRL